MQNWKSGLCYVATLPFVLVLLDLVVKLDKCGGLTEWRLVELLMLYYASVSYLLIKAKGYRRKPQPRK